MEISEEVLLECFSEIYTFIVGKFNQRALKYLTMVLNELLSDRGYWSEIGVERWLSVVGMVFNELGVLLRNEDTTEESGEEGLRNIVARARQSYSETPLLMSSPYPSYPTAPSEPTPTNRPRNVFTQSRAEHLQRDLCDLKEKVRRLRVRAGVKESMNKELKKAVDKVMQEGGTYKSLMSQLLKLSELFVSGSNKKGYSVATQENIIKLVQQISSLSTRLQDDLNWLQDFKAKLKHDTSAHILATFRPSPTGSSASAPFPTSTHKSFRNSPLDTTYTINTSALDDQDEQHDSPVTATSEDQVQINKTYSVSSKSSHTNKRSKSGPRGSASRIPVSNRSVHFKEGLNRTYDVTPTIPVKVKAPKSA